MWNKLKDSKLVYVIFSILFAILLWIYVDNIVKPDIKINIRGKAVTLVGVDELERKHLMIDNDSEPVVNLTLSGNRAAISQLNRSNVSVQANVADQITEEGEAELEYVVIFPSNVNTSSVKVRVRTPEKVSVSVFRTQKKSVNVVGEFSGSVSVGYLREEDAFELATKQIILEGKAEQVESVDHAVVNLEEDNLQDTWTGSLPITLVDANGETVSMEDMILSRDKVDVTFKVSAVKEVPLTVMLKEGGGATAKDVTCTIEPAAVMVSGPKETLAELESINLGSVDLGQVITSEKREMTIAMPDGCRNVSAGNLASVSVKINKELVTKKYEISNIIIKNVPEGYTAEPVSSHAVVRVRGDEESMSLLMKEDIEVTADLSKIKAGTTGNYTVFATIKVKGLSDVGVIGNCEVTVYIS